MKKEYVFFGEYLKNRRKEVHLTQQALSEKTGVPKSTISGIETGRFFPSTETSSALAQALDLTIEEFLEEKDRAKEKASVVAPVVSQRIASKGTTDIEDEVGFEEIYHATLDDKSEDESIKVQLILIERFNKLTPSNKKQLLEIAQVLINNQQ
ncbi:helix-turn-helix transcriptional regulator [Enterococcus faecalis]|uniref:helix-turn-helix domain-containing protein n=1 Tax=Enterococcus faecalis TaxID=1351 RepID=UPI001574207A|nr:helix-turn-helix transcriptional regulator [Enterococcus faecalis]NSW13763.1 helix-turn-helix transcriptional regulator [Enterococcus faecalis]